MLFVDSGLAWFADNDSTESLGIWPIDDDVRQRAEMVKAEDSFDDLTWSRLKTNVGIALASHDDDFRINFAKRTDRSGSDIVITFRISQEF